MSSTAFATQSHATKPLLPSCPHEDSPACPHNLRAEIIVLAGGLRNGRQHPLHARAIPLQSSSQTQARTVKNFCRNARGIAFNLTKRERISAFGFGVLFTTLSLAAAIL